jgi:septal ring-binding cell division protein DamX
VSATETPTTPPAEEQATRRCPRCAAPLTPQQEWCLNCGADVGSRIVGAPSWRGPVALVVGLLTIAAIALILALVELAGDAEQVAPPAAQTATPTPTPTTAGIPGSTPTPDSVTIPPATADEPTGGTPEIADWPDGKDAWTVVLESSSTRAAAEARAKELAGQGVPVGILDSNGYSSLEPGHFVVFSGQYDSKRAADQALEDLSNQVTGGYVRHVIPSASTGGATVTPSPSPSSTATPLTP